MSAFPSLQQFAWMLFGILGHGTLLAAAILFLRGRGAGPWMLLIGSIIGLVGGVTSNVLSFAMMVSSSPGWSVQILHAVSALASFGWLLTCAGVLVIAFQFRALVTRNQELESILSAHQENR